VNSSQSKLGTWSALGVMWSGRNKRAQSGAPFFLQQFRFKDHCANNVALQLRRAIRIQPAQKKITEKHVIAPSAASAY
jgi:hypothetical protein